MNDTDRVDAALGLALEWGGIDGAHHKQWLIDQMVRVLAEEDYDGWLADFMRGDDGPATYEWDTGIAP
jgi:hypothetical protein